MYNLKIIKLFVHKRFFTTLLLFHIHVNVIIQGVNKVPTPLLTFEEITELLVMVIYDQRKWFLVYLKISQFSQGIT